MPARLIQRLVGYYILRGSSRPEHRTLLQAVVATACGLPILGVHIEERSGTDARSALVFVGARDAGSFARLFPSSQRVKTASARIAVFRLYGDELCP